MATGRHRLRLSPAQRIALVLTSALLLLGAPLFSLTAGSSTPASAATTDAPAKAVAWARAQLGSRAYDNPPQCLRFVYDAYRLGAGLDTKGGMATTAQTSAYDFWTHFPGLQHRGDTNPPAGTFVFWGPRAGYPDGHVALSLGNHQVISSVERRSPGVHIFGLADRTGYNYLGWMMPPGVSGGAVTPAPAPKPVAPSPVTPPGANMPVFTVMNTSEPPPDGVWFRDNPNANGPRLNGYGVYRNDRVQLRCYGWGPAIGAYGNRLWYFSANLTRPNAPGRPNIGWLNAHFINDGQNANAVVPGSRPC